MAGTLSLSKSLRTDKVALGVPEVGAGFRLFDSNMQAEIPTTMIDHYGRPAALYAGNQFLGFGAPGVFTPLYRIETENMLRPQYSEYLNLPQGLIMPNNEYPNRPHTDLMGVNRDRAFAYDGTYQMMKYPTKSENPSSDADWYSQQAWYNNHTVQKFDNRLWLSSADVQSGF